MGYWRQMDLKKEISRSMAMQIIQQGKVVKADLTDGLLEVKKVKSGVFEVSIVSEEEIEGTKEHIYLGDFKGLMKSINGVIGKAGMYIEE